MNKIHRKLHFVEQSSLTNRRMPLDQLKPEYSKRALMRWKTSKWRKSRREIFKVVSHKSAKKNVGELENHFSRRNREIGESFAHSEKIMSGMVMAVSRTRQLVRNLIFVRFKIEKWGGSWSEKKNFPPKVASGFRLSIKTSFHTSWKKIGSLAHYFAPPPRILSSILGKVALLAECQYNWSH